MRSLAESLWVAFGAAIGANARYWIGVLAKAHLQAFPWPTLLINVVGSLLLGRLLCHRPRERVGLAGRLFAVGLCGGFTTFSTFSFEVIELMTARNWKAAALYALLSLLLSVGGCLLGARLALVASGQTNPTV